MTRFAQFLRTKLTGLRMIFTFAAIYIASQITILYILYPLDLDRVMDMQLALFAEEFLWVIQPWLDSGDIVYYWRHFIFDFFHPIWNALMLVALMATALNFSERSARYNYLVFLPMVPALCDYVENVMHIVFLLNPETVTDTSVLICGSFTHTKWSLYRVSFWVSMTFVFLGLFLKYQRKSS